MFAHDRALTIIDVMCGRFTAKNPNLIKKRFEEFDLHGPSLPARYNIGPAQLLLVIATDEKNKPVTQTMTWGFVPLWATLRDEPFKPRINAMSDKLHPMFKAPLAKRRCLVPADGYYEWKSLGNDLKEPHHFQLKNGEPFCFAGVYEPGSNEGADTVAIFTTTANALSRTIHSRMPVILQGEAARIWLKAGPLAPDEFCRLSAPCPAEQMDEWPVSTRVGNVKNEGPELVVPVQAGEIMAERPDGQRLPLRSRKKSKDEEKTDLLPGFDL